MVEAVEFKQSPVVGSGSSATVDFYDRTAEEYFDQTVSLDIAGFRDMFLDELRPGARILDVGSGSGRDTLAFLEKGMIVDAFDASPRLAALSSRFTGRETRVLRVEDWEPTQTHYDGIWAFASLLHVPIIDLPLTLRKLAQSLKPGGVFFASFKLGSGEAIDDDGRAFTLLDVDEASRLVGSVCDLEEIKIWSQTGPDSRQQPTSWLYVFARKT